MNEFILFNTTCYKLISTNYNVHYELPYFAQCHVILGVNNNCKLPLRKYVFQSDRQVLSCNIISR